MDGRDTLHDSTITDGLNEWQSGHHENGQGGREDLKQDGETTLSATWVLRGQEQLETGVCGNSSGRGSSLRSERNPGGKW